jgi:hypothetical protein
VGRSLNVFSWSIYDMRWDSLNEWSGQQHIDVGPYPMQNSNPLSSVRALKARASDRALTGSHITHSFSLTYMLATFINICLKLDV